MQQQQQQLGFEESSNIGSHRVSLLIRHLPEAIPEETLFRLLSHYGASSVRSCSATGRLRNCAFVDFQNEGLAYQAQRQLNGLRFLGKVLKVERATANNDKPSQAANKDSLSITATSKSSLVHNPTINRDIQETEVSRSEPIAPRLGVDYPFPPHLEYAYPPPDGNILTNIVNALIAVPRFYTQVLHLMNKMNIPAPFRMALPSPPLPPSVPVPPPPPPPLAAKPPSADLSSEESEMESSDEEVDGKPSSGTSRGRKRVKREAIVGPAVDKDVAHEDVGLKPAILVPKERPMIKKKNPIVQIKIAPKVVNNEHKDDSITKDSEHPKNESSDINSFATPEELERGKLPPEEILSLPMFKNYAAGNPASVLYIKNLAKDIVADDFYYIFGSLFGSVDAAKSGLSLKLMQEGRMRGQAFVTFPSVELAHYALNLVNGYVFKGKPMIIQFGRNPAVGKAN
ncbi:PREDICTED: U11/U12 small nuclear ribonucleoprotein 65 kDa protein isoform X1 [Prunus mume]|uniref:U11/U12 small nuclear ribonucleoprotein 65 kDa protein isoform X1 n=1 Tax=Prunus mume TaxID=102107 RepID=A0ABM1LT42_PRUMU|nr:PREDICTED: U11/U12 small nuclear ribonucleoprotein 65 kDa protein isoform X1 [Prunus mume]XP_016650569.1 PREDICTED: U11/U12 small nuclear ribonucleoprotein 65 kDa protein isoform X1 [Prunus mume]